KRARVGMMHDRTKRGAACAGRLLSGVHPRRVDHFVGRVRRVLQSLRLFGACHKKQCLVDWLSNRILKTFDNTAATPGTASIGYGKIMSLARRDWVAERQGGEAHRPVLANPEAAAPRTLDCGGGSSKKFKTVGAQGAAASSFCYICKKSSFS